MSKTCEYVSKKIIKDYKKVMEDTLPKVQRDVKDKYTKSFQYMIVGSAKRNLVVQKGGSHWDVDYQLFFHSPKFHDEDAPELKIFVKKRFKHHLGEEYSVNLSTSVITICLKDDIGQHAIKSFDVALLKLNEQNEKTEILRGTTDDKKDIDNYIKWEILSEPPKAYNRRKEIRGPEMWKYLREIFISKKCIELDKAKDEQIPTFSIYAESIKETLEKFKKW